MRAEFEYSEADVREIILKHHNTVWGNFTGDKVWVARIDYRGVIVNLEEPEKQKEGTDG